MTTVQISDDLRFTFEADDQPEDPREGQPGVSVHVLHGYTRHEEPTPGEDSRAERIEIIKEQTWRDSEVRDAVSKHMERAGITHIIRHDERGATVWYIELDTEAQNVQLAPEWDAAAYLRSEVDIYYRWADGNVDQIVMERREHYVRMIDGVVYSDLYKNSWEQDDVIGGIYHDSLDDADLAETALNAGFDLTEEEERAIEEFIEKRNAEHSARKAALNG